MHQGLLAARSAATARLKIPGAAQCMQVLRDVPSRAHQAASAALAKLSRWRVNQRQYADDHSYNS